jgi:hypothetical protein
VALLATNCPLAWSQIYPSGAILGIGSHLVLLEIQVQRVRSLPGRWVKHRASHLFLLAGGTRVP